MKIPPALKWIVGIAHLQIAWCALVFMTLVVVTVAPATNGFWQGFEEAAVRSFSHARNVDEFGAEQFGESLAKTMITLAFPVAVVLCVRRKKRTALLVALALSIALKIGQHGFPLLILVQLILASRKSVDRYMNPDKPPPLHIA